MARSFLERLHSGEVLVSDGATGTNHQLRGLGLGIPPEEWVFDEPGKVSDLHRAFVDAGSDIILTDTFGGTRLRMRDSKYADRAPELNRRAAELARIAASERDGVLVAGSMGPTGMLCEPLGELTHAGAVANYAEQATALAEGGVNFLMLETFFALEEAMAAIEGVRQASDLPLVVSFSYDQGTRTMMGLRPAQVVEALAPLGLAAIGANCGKTLDAMAQIVEEMAAMKSGLPLWIKPNAGLPRMVGDVAEYDVEPERMAAYAARYVEAGAQIVGGCCGSTPAHVAAIARAVRQLNPQMAQIAAD
jgi:5-methyltetrahydrofolate--homocysteine methyltransferase